MIKLTRPPCPYPKALDDKNYKHPTNKAALAQASHNKCMYCESVISHIDFGHVEHIKPKAEDKFPELEFDWSNLGFVCPKCNNAKSDKHFPDAPFIDPYSEDPEGHVLAVGAILMARKGSVRGEVTIQEIGLNRPDLLERRYQRIVDIDRAIKAAYRTTIEVLRVSALEELHKEAECDKEFSLVVKTLLAAHV